MYSIGMGRMLFLSKGSTCSDPGYPPSTFRYASDRFDPEEAITIGNMKVEGRLYYKCIRSGYQLFLQSNSMAINSTECDGSTFAPLISDMTCIGEWPCANSYAAHVEPCLQLSSPHTDVESPQVEYCPDDVQVFKFSSYNSTNLFAGSALPMFTDNTGMQYPSVPVGAELIHMGCNSGVLLQALKKLLLHLRGSTWTMSSLKTSMSHSLQPISV